MDYRRLLNITLVLGICGNVCTANKYAKVLYRNLMSDYNKLIRPVSNSSERLTIKLGMKLSQLIAVDEKNQVMTTNVWLSQEWNDYYLRWDPDEYAGVDSLYIPAEHIWTPDIVLYNNADGSFQVTMATKATVSYDGKVVWEPPAIYKSSCNIDVEFFPFDEQTCSMKFSSWTYVYDQVDLKHMYQADVDGEVSIPYAIDMSEYFASFIWDVMKVPAVRHEVKYPCCPEVFPDVTFYITIRRKTLFYTVNLIIPCISISLLTILVFYLPSDSGERITLCISVLLALTVFFLLLSELIPPTSLVVPLIGKYLLFTMILVTLSIIITVVSLNLHSRSVTTHVMPVWLRALFIEKLPTILLMERPDIHKLRPDYQAKTQSSIRSSNRSSSAYSRRSVKVKGANDFEMVNLLPRTTDSPHLIHANGSTRKQAVLLSPTVSQLALHPQIEKALDAVEFIANHLHREDLDNQVEEDWKYISMVFDRLFFILFTIAGIAGCLGVMLQAPTLYDGKQPLSP